ncbi:VOC family protein [Caulobacter sp. 602-2]|uniref:VOC family protein n=1 Tax=Caulobacter sp. 602-2 TaxID=2710887 RepID=A0A6G4R391_9CAUL|nr:VOC family protein [Caulobacter sp. 602-2]NGM52396.1 VOC family protein [Caulobacter sp. 602-2]
MRMIFVNLPVADLGRSKAFFEALGFSINPQFSDETAACVVVSETIFVMLLTHDKFRQFITGEISDAHAATEVLTCLSAGSREEVDDLLAKALANGGKAWKPIMDMGPMYGASFQDPDGHVWEVMYMDMAAMEQGG